MGRMASLPVGANGRQDPGARRLGGVRAIGNRANRLDTFTAPCQSVNRCVVLSFARPQRPRHEDHTGAL